MERNCCLETRMTPPDRLKIVNIVTQMEAGGAQSAAIRLACALRDRGHAVETWFLYRKRPTFDGEAGVRVFAPRRPRSLLGYLSLGIAVTAQLRRLRPDVVVTFTHYANVLGGAAAYLAGIRARIATHRSPAHAQPKLAQVLNCAFGIIGVYTANIAVSSTVVESFARYPKRFRRTLTLIHNGVTLEPSTLTRDAARMHLRLPLGVPIIGTVGRLAAVKDHAVLIRALARLPGCYVAIAGDGELRPELDALAASMGAAERVLFLGELSPIDVRHFLRAIDVFAFCSKHEAFGFAAAEAALAQVPIVCTRIPAMVEIFGAPEGEERVLFFEVGDDAGLAARIQVLLDDPQLARKLAKAARERAQFFSFDRMVEGYERLIIRAAAVGRTPNARAV